MHFSMLVMVIMLMILCPFLICSGNHRGWVVHSGMFVMVITLMIPCPFFILLCQWYSGWVVHSGILVTVIILIPSCSFHYSIYSGNYRRWVVNFGILVTVIILMISFPLCPALTIIVGELYILACWWLWLYWWFHVHSSCCIDNHSVWVVHSGMLLIVIMLMVSCSFIVGELCTYFGMLVTDLDDDSMSISFLTLLWQL